MVTHFTNIWVVAILIAACVIDHAYGQVPVPNSESCEKKCWFAHGNTSFEMSCDANRMPASDLDERVTVLEVDDYPDNQQFWTEIGNGHVATVVKSDSIFMNGLYNGKEGTSHRARIPSTIAHTIISISSNITNKKVALDLGRGMFYEKYEGADFYVELRTYAHRVLPTVLVVELVIAETSPNRTEDIVVYTKINIGNDSVDIAWSELKDLGDSMLMNGQTKVPEYPGVSHTPVVVLAHTKGSAAFLPRCESKRDLFYITSISKDMQQARDGLNKAIEYVENGTLLRHHVDAWSRLWQQGRIDFEGNLTMSRLNYASLYYMLSSLPLTDVPNWPFVGMSPGGLAHGEANKDYMGHVFWDQDTWMYPPIMMLHPDLGRKIVGTRIRTLDAARYHAATTGYEGARYPWESGFTGLETTPGKVYGDFEVHITGDVSLAFRQYLQLTEDLKFLKDEQGLDAIKDMADFWVSRAKLNTSSKLYEILEVMPPDEWHRPVNNSVYTNVIAKISLQTGIYAMNMIGRTPPKVWQEVADNLYIPFDEELQFHPEFDGYNITSTEKLFGYVQQRQVKQADVVMLGFPLMSQSSDKHVQMNDLQMYAEVTPWGPAMTWGVYVINWLELGNKSIADSLFHKTTLNAQLPFYIWTEYQDGTGAVNFQTGMGGYLQAILFGYGGIRITDTELVFNPQLPPSVSKYTFTGVDYLGSSFNLEVDQDNMTLTPTHLSRPMKIKLAENRENDLTHGKPVMYARQKASIMKSFPQTKTTPSKPRNSKTTPSKSCNSCTRYTLSYLLFSWVVLVAIVLK